MIFSECVAAMGRKMMSAKHAQVQVIPEGFFDDVKPAEMLTEIQNRSICAWGSDVSPPYRRRLAQPCSQCSKNDVLCVIFSLAAKTCPVLEREIK